MSRTRLLAYGFAILLVAAVVLLVATHHKARPPHVASTPTGSATPTGSITPTGSTSPPRAPGVEGSATPVVADGSPTPPAERTTTSYMVDGNEVHDHRRGTHAPITIVPAYPPDAHRINVAITRAITSQLQAAVHECAAAVPPEARGPKPKVEGQILIAIAKTQVSVVKTSLVLSDLVGASVDPTRACIEQKAALITTAAPNEPDLAAYPISLSLAII